MMQQQIQGLMQVNQDQKRKMIADAANHNATHMFHHSGAVNSGLDVSDITCVLFVVS